MKKSEKTYTVSGVEMNESNYRQFFYLTQDNKESAELFLAVLDNSSCVGEAIIKMREFLINTGKRGNVTLNNLELATKDELYELLNELFIQKFSTKQIDQLLDRFTIEQIWQYKNNGYSNPIRLLTFSKEYAIERFRLN